MQQTEIWKDIPGYEGLYQASSLGRIRSLDHKAIRILKDGTVSYRPYKGRILSKIRNGRCDMYYLTLSKRNVRYEPLVCTLVALAFIPKPANLRYVMHINGDLTDDRPENLRWCSQGELRRFYSSLKHN